MRTDLFKKDVKVTSSYGWRTHPITKKKHFHNGIDFSTVVGTPIYVPKSFNNSRVRLAQADKYGGKYIQLERISDGKGLYALHISGFKKKVGDIVKTGDLIALSGNTGLSTAPHTHIGVQKDADVWGSHEDPMPYLISESPKMKKGDRVICIKQMNVRDIPDGRDIGDVKVGAVAEVIGENRKSGDYYWYLVKWGDFAGWLADTDFNEKTSKPMTNLNASKIEVIDPELQKEVITLREENTALRTQLTNAENTIKEGEGQMLVLLEQMQDISAELGEASKELKQSEDKYATLKIRFNTLENDKLEVQKELDELKTGRDDWINRLADILHKLFGGNK